MVLSLLRLSDEPRRRLRYYHLFDGATLARTLAGRTEVAKHGDKEKESCVYLGGSGCADGSLALVDRYTWGHYYALAEISTVDQTLEIVIVFYPFVHPDLFLE